MYSIIHGEIKNGNEVFRHFISRHPPRSCFDSVTCSCYFSIVVYSTAVVCFLCCNFVLSSVATNDELIASGHCGGRITWPTRCHVTGKCAVDHRSWRGGEPASDNALGIEELRTRQCCSRDTGTGRRSVCVTSCPVVSGQCDAGGECPTLAGCTQQTITSTLGDVMRIPLIDLFIGHLSTTNSL